MNISVVIPTYNRKLILKKCLLALEDQLLNNRINSYEIIVIDDGSTDGTTKWINENKQKLPHVVLYEQSHAGPALARNLGVLKSKNEIIIFIDSDLVVVNDFLINHVNKLNNYKFYFNLICCTTIVYTSSNITSTIRSYISTQISFFELSCISTISLLFFLF